MKAAAAAAAAAAASATVAGGAAAVAQLRAAHDVLVAQLAHLSTGGSLLSLPLSLLRPRESACPAAAAAAAAATSSLVSTDAAPEGGGGGGSSAVAAGSAQAQVQAPVKAVKTEQVEGSAPLEGVVSPLKATSTTQVSSPSTAPPTAAAPTEDNPRRRALDALEAARRDLARRAVVLERAEDILADRKRLGDRFRVIGAYEYNWRLPVWSSLDEYAYISSQAESPIREMQWMATDFAQERRWKIEAARVLNLRSCQSKAKGTTMPEAPEDTPPDLFYKRTLPAGKRVLASLEAARAKAAVEAEAALVAAEESLRTAVASAMAAARRDMAAPRADDEFRRKRKKHEQPHTISTAGVDRNDARAGESKISLKIQLKSSLPPSANTAGPSKQLSNPPPSLDPAAVPIPAWGQSANLVSGTPGPIPREAVTPAGGPVGHPGVLKKEKKRRKRERDDGMGNLMYGLSSNSIRGGQILLLPTLTGLDPIATPMPKPDAAVAARSLTPAAVAAAQLAKPNLAKSSSKDPLLNQATPSASAVQKKPLSNLLPRQGGDAGNSAKKAGEILMPVGTTAAERPKDVGDSSGKPRARRKLNKAISVEAIGASVAGAAAATSFSVPWRPLEDQALCSLVTEFGRAWGLVTELLGGPARFAGTVRRKESECRSRYQQLTENANAKGKEAGGPETASVSMSRNQARQILGRCLPISHDVLRTHVLSLRQIGMKISHQHKQQASASVASLRTPLAAEHNSHQRARLAGLNSLGLTSQPRQPLAVIDQLLRQSQSQSTTPVAPSAGTSEAPLSLFPEPVAPAPPAPPLGPTGNSLDHKIPPLATPGSTTGDMSKPP